MRVRPPQAAGHGKKGASVIRHIFIINPAAGKRETTRRLEEQLSRLSVPHEVFYTREAGEARKIAERAAAEGVPARLYACGGDGTLNEVVNGAAGHDFLAVTNVPKGTGNDFLKLFGPQYRERFSDLEALAAGPQTAFDLMDCNGKLGLDVICAGVDARIAAGVHRYKRLKGVSGRWAYLLSLAEQVFLRGITRPMTVEMGARRWEEAPTAVLCICNGRHYGGGFMPVGDAMPDDGILDALRVGDVGLPTFLHLVGKYAKGLYWKYPQWIDAYHGREVSFSAQAPITVVVDGEVMEDTRFTVRLSEKQVNFFYPAGLSYQPEKRRN